MTDSPNDGTKPSTNEREIPRRLSDEHSDLLSLVVGSVDEPTCTIYPANVAVPHRSTAWVTATGDAFVDREKCR